MQNLFRTKSYLLFLFLYCSFFSCGRLLDFIKPQLPKPVEETCRLVREKQGTRVQDYLYDSKGRVAKIFVDPNPEDANPLRFVYDTIYYTAAGQISGQRQVRIRAGFDRTFEYDQAGRVIKSVTENNGQFEPLLTNDYTYTANTIKVKTTATHPLEPTRTWETTYFIENENLVKIRLDKSENGLMDGAEITFEYSNTLNKLSAAERKLAYVKGFSPAISKYLVSKADYNSTSGVLTSYSWQLNAQGYPVKQTAVDKYGYSEILYEYSCGKH